MGAGAVLVARAELGAVASVGAGLVVGAVARVNRSGVQAAVAHSLSTPALAPHCITSHPPSPIAM